MCEFNVDMHGINFNDPANYENILRDLTGEKVRKVMNDLYEDSNIVDVVFLPLEQEEANQ